MTDVDNSGESANQQLDITTREGSERENMQSSDMEMTVESTPTSDPRTEGSNAMATANSSTGLQAYTTRQLFGTTNKGSEDTEMSLDPHSMTENIIESLKSQDATHLLIHSTKPEPAPESAQPGVGGTRFSRPFQKRRSDEFVPVSDDSSDLPILKKHRLESKHEEEPPVRPTRKVYRGIGSGQGALSINDRSSYTLPMVTIEQQARREPDFIGEAYFHDLRYDHVREMMEGTYMVVYSQSFPSNGSDGDFETYTPSMTTKSIEIFPLGAATPPGNGMGKSVKYNGDWGEAEVNFNGFFCLLALQQKFPQDGLAATCVAHHQKPVDEDATCVLHEVLAFGTRKIGSSVRFGMKYMRTIEEQGKWPIYLGFEFVALNLATWDLATNKPSMRRLIGVKIPPKKDVASGFLLNQVLHLPADMSCLVHRGSMQQAPAAARNSENMRDNGGSSRSNGKSWADKAAASGAVFKQM